MTLDEKHLFCVAADAFLLAEKWLREGQPDWEPGSHPNQMIAMWSIDEEDRDESRAYLVFSVYKATRDQPSVSLIFLGREICRVDVKPHDAEDGNPAEAMLFGLPMTVHGSHIHLWKFNRAHILREKRPDEWNIPVKTPISRLARKPRHILACICNYCGIYATSEQRDFNPPKRKDFAGGKQ